MTPAARTAPRNAERRAVAAILFAAVAVFADMYLTQPVLPEIVREYAVSPALAGFTISALVLGIALSSSAYGPLADYLGRKRVMVGGCALLAVATSGCAFAPTFATLVALRFVQGLLVPAVSAIAVTALGEMRTGRDPGGLVGAYIAATVLGGLLSRVGSGLIADVSSWRTSFVVFGGLTLLAGGALALTLRRERAARPARARRAFAQSYRAMGRHFGDRRLLGAFVVGATLFFGFIGLFTYLPFLLSQPPFSLSSGTISWVYAAYVAGVFTAPVAGRLSARYSRRALMAGGFIIALCGLALTAAHSLAWIVTGTVVVCIGMFSAQAVAPAFVNVTASEAKGGANALYQAFYYVGAVFGSTLPGLAWQRFGWSGVLATCAASFGLGLAAALFFCHERSLTAPGGFAESR